MSRWPSGETVMCDELGLVATDSVIDHDGGVVHHSTQTGDCKLTDPAHVRIATVKEIWSGLPNKIFKAFCHHECACICNAQSHPASIPLPELATPFQCRRGSFGSCASRNEKHTDKENDDTRCDDGDGNQDTDSDGFRFMRKGNIGIN